MNIPIRRTQKAGLIIPNRSIYGDSVSIPSETRCCRNRGKHIQRNIRFFQCVQIKASIRDAEQAKTGSVSRIDHRRGDSRQQHSDIVRDRTKYDRVGRDKAILQIIVVRNKTVSGCKRVTGQAA